MKISPKPGGAAPLPATSLPGSAQRSLLTTHQAASLSEPGSTTSTWPPFGRDSTVVAFPLTTSNVNPFRFLASGRVTSGVRTASPRLLTAIPTGSCTSEQGADGSTSSSCRRRVDGYQPLRPLARRRAERPCHNPVDPAAPLRRPVHSHIPRPASHLRFRPSRRRSPLARPRSSASEAPITSSGRGLLRSRRTWRRSKRTFGRSLAPRARCSALTSRHPHHRARLVRSYRSWRPASMPATSSPTSLSSCPRR
jgi:hypothetical protein